MQNEFEIILVGVLKFFHGFEVKQMKDETFLYQKKYAKELVKRFGLKNSKPACTYMSTIVKLHEDPSSK